jgi:hypothetical protein
VTLQSIHVSVPIVFTFVFVVRLNDWIHCCVIVDVELFKMVGLFVFAMIEGETPLFTHTGAMVLFMTTAAAHRTGVSGD